MDQPPDLPPPLQVHRPQPPERPKRPVPSWSPPNVPAAPPAAKARSKPPVIAVLAGIVGFAVMALVGRGVGQRLAARLFDKPPQTDALTSDPYFVIKEAYARGARQFRIGVARGSALAVRRSAPQAALVFDPEATVDDIGGVFRTTVGYRGTLPMPERGPSPVEGEQRRYFHHNGAIIVDALCLTEDSMCVSRDQLMTTTEAAVMANLSGEGVDALLPGDGVCRPVEVQGALGPNRVTLCKLGSDMVITVQRLSLWEARFQLNAAGNDKELRGMAEDAARGEP
jgi:hypothetical protein